jgi:hypothetical protein
VRARRRRAALVSGHCRGKVDRIKASVFVVHGLNDFNVKTKAFAEWWYRLAKAGVERKIWLHNGGHGGHGGPGGAGATAYRTQQNRWFDHYLFGVANGIQGEPKTSVQRKSAVPQSFTDRGRELDTDDVLIQRPTRRTRTGSSIARRRCQAPCA